MKKRRIEDVYGIYMPRYYRHNYFTKIFKENWDTFMGCYYSHPGLVEKYGDLTDYQIDTVEKFLSYINYRYLKIAWRERILRLLINFRKMNSNEAHWFRLKYPKGFMVNGQIKDTVNDYNIKHRLCQYMARGIISNRNILYYSRHKKEVIIQYKYDKKYHKRKYHIYNFMASILQHVDNITQHARYYGA